MTKLIFILLIFSSLAMLSKGFVKRYVNDVKYNISEFNVFEKEILISGYLADKIFITSIDKESGEINYTKEIYTHDTISYTNTIKLPDNQIISFIKFSRYVSKYNIKTYYGIVKLNSDFKVEENIIFDGQIIVNGIYLRENKIFINGIAGSAPIIGNLDFNLKNLKIKIYNPYYSAFVSNLVFSNNEINFSCGNYRDSSIVFWKINENFDFLSCTSIKNNNSNNPNFIEFNNEKYYYISSYKQSSKTPLYYSIEVFDENYQLLKFNDYIIQDGSQIKNSILYKDNIISDYFRTDENNFTIVGFTKFNVHGEKLSINEIKTNRVILNSKFAKDSNYLYHILVISDPKLVFEISKISELDNICFDNKSIQANNSKFTKNIVEELFLETYEAYFFDSTKTDFSWKTDNGSGFSITNGCYNTPIFDLIDTCFGFELREDLLNNFISNGDVKVVDDNIQLTGKKKLEVSNIWSAAGYNIDKGFATKYSFRFRNGQNSSSAESSEPGADGISLLISGREHSETGLFGGGIGYMGLDNTIAIELDLFQNKEYNDSNGNHFAIQIPKNNILSAIHNSENTLALNNDIPIIVSDNSTYTIEVILKGDTLQVYLAGENILKEKVFEIYDFDIKDYVQPNSNGEYYFGLSSATGDSYQIHEVLDWKLCTYQDNITKDIYINDKSSNSLIIENNLIIQDINHSNFKSIKVSDILGNTFAIPYQIEGNQMQIDLSKLETGLYFYQINCSDKLVNNKFIKN